MIALSLMIDKEEGNSKKMFEISKGNTLRSHNRAKSLLVVRASEES